MIPSFKAPDAPLARRHRGGAAVVFAYLDVPLESGAGSGGHIAAVQASIASTGDVKASVESNIADFFFVDESHPCGLLLSLESPP
jgi:hypothetical protein